MASAQSDALRLLSLAWYPAGSRQLATWIHLKGYLLSEPDQQPGDPDHVDLARFYLSGPKSQGVSWLNTRRPVGGSIESLGGKDRADLGWSYSFAATAILPDADLQYSKRILPDGNVEFRIDAQVVWTPRKSRYSIIPSGATLMTADFTPGIEQSTPKLKKRNVATTELSVMTNVRNKINELPVAYPGIASCPAEILGTVNVSFYRSGRARPFATAHFDSSSCGDVHITLFSSSGHSLGSGHDGGGFAAVPSLVKLLGLSNIY